MKKFELQVIRQSEMVPDMTLALVKGGTAASPNTTCGTNSCGKFIGNCPFNVCSEFTGDCTVKNCVPDCTQNLCKSNCPSNKIEVDPSI